MQDRSLRMLAASGLAVGAILGMAGTLAPTDALRGLAWGIDGVALVMAAALMAVRFLRLGDDLAAAGFLVFAAGQGLILSGAAMDLERSIPSFGAGAGLWAAGLALIGAARVFPFGIRILGLVAAALFAATALRIFAGAPLSPTAAPLPLLAYPVLVATMAGWIWRLLRRP